MLCFISSFALNSSRSIFASSPFCRFVLLPFRYFFSRFKTEENETHLSKFCSFSLSRCFLPASPTLLSCFRCSPLFTIPACCAIILPSGKKGEKQNCSFLASITLFYAISSPTGDAPKGTSGVQYLFCIDTQADNCYILPYNVLTYFFVIFGHIWVLGQ